MEHRAGAGILAPFVRIKKSGNHQLQIRSRRLPSLTMVRSPWKSQKRLPAGGRPQAGASQAQVQVSNPYRLARLPRKSSWFTLSNTLLAAQKFAPFSSLIAGGWNPRRTCPSRGTSDRSRPCSTGRSVATPVRPGNRHTCSGLVRTFPRSKRSPGSRLVCGPAASSVTCFSLWHQRRLARCSAPAGQPACRILCG